MGLGFSQTIPLEVRLAGSEDKGPHQGMLYGTIPGRNIIVGGFETIEFSEGDELVVKSTIGSHVIGFWAKVEQCVAGREKLYLLTYPKQVDELNLRKTERVNVMIPVEMNHAAGGAGETEEINFKGLLLNISDGGCLLRSERPWPDDLHCGLKFTLPGEADSFILSGEVVRLNGEGNRVGNFGVQFGNGPINARALKELRDWIAEKRTFLMC